MSVINLKENKIQIRINLESKKTFTISIISFLDFLDFMENKVSLRKFVGFSLNNIYIDNSNHKKL